MLRKGLLHALLPLGLGVAACSPQAAAPASAPPPSSAPLPFREGGLAAALTDARRDHKLVFVDLWATWCPPCMAMRAWSFDAPEVRALADTFVWLSIDRDGPEGDDAVERWHLRTLPVLIVLDPETSAPRMRWDTPLSGPELAAFLRLGAQTPLPDGAAEAFSVTRVLYQDDDDGRAARARAEDALRRLAPSSPLAPFLVSALVSAAHERHDLEACARLAEEWVDRLPDTGVVSNVALDARGCAMGATPPNLAVAGHQLARAGAILGNRRSPVLPFERGYSSYRVQAFRLEAGDKPGADDLTARWWSFVHDEWPRANAPQRASLAAPVEFWLDRAGSFAQAASVMGDIARESPGDVDALRRWGVALAAAGRVDDGIQGIERGLPAIAPEKRLPAIWEEAELLEKKGDKATEAALLEAALRLPRAAHVAHRSEKLRADIEKRLSEIRASTPPPPPAAR